MGDIITICCVIVLFIFTFVLIQKRIKSNKAEIESEKYRFRSKIIYESRYSMIPLYLAIVFGALCVIVFVAIMSYIYEWDELPFLNDVVTSDTGLILRLALFLVNLSPAFVLFYFAEYYFMLYHSINWQVLAVVDDAVYLKPRCTQKVLKSRLPMTQKILLSDIDSVVVGHNSSIALLRNNTVTIYTKKRDYRIEMVSDPYSVKKAVEDQISKIKA